MNLSAVAQAFKPLDQDVVFVGGATTALYVENPGIDEIRATEDVDCVVEVDLGSNTSRSKSVYVFPAKCFLASKFEALLNRGMSDLVMSQDFQDIVFVIDGIGNSRVPGRRRHAASRERTVRASNSDRTLPKLHRFRWSSTAPLTYLKRVKPERFKELNQ